VEFRGDGDLLVSSSWDDTVRLWDLVTRSQVTSCAGILARFARDGRHLGVLGTDSQVQFWELAGGRECRTLRHPVAGKGPYDLDLSPDGRILASSAEDGVRLWDLSRAKQIASLLGEYTMTARFSPATGELISSGAKGLRRRAIRLPEPGAPKTGSKVAIGPPETVFPRPAGRAAVSQDGRTVAVVPKDGEEPSILRVFHRGNPGSETRLLAPPAFRHYVAVSPDGRWVAAGTWQGAGQATGVRVWEARSGRLLREFRLGSNVNVAFSPDGRWLATMTGQEYRLWRTGSWQPGPAFPREVAERNPGALVFSPDGTAIAIAHSPRVVQLIDIATGREFARLEAPNVQRSMPFCFSRDGTLLVTQGNPELIQVWDLRLIRDQLRSMGLGWRP
jgi:WD40 repeat protein